jgi:glycosyltransferase involved in cell wall biosynthesis
MNILHLSTRIKIKYGGGEKFLETFLDGFTRDKHTLLGSDPVVEEIFRKRGFEVHSSPSGYEPITKKRQLFIPISFVLGLVQFIKNYKLIRDSDLILVSCSSIAEPIWLLPWVQLFFPQKKVVQFMHALCIPYYSHNPMTWLLRKVWSKMEIIFVSNYQKQTWLDSRLSGKINHVIHNGVEIYDFVPKIKEKNDPIRFGYIGRMYFEKGVDTMIQAISLLDPGNQKIEVLMAGTGEQLEEFQKLQQDLPLHPNISYKWLGFVTDTKGFYESIDLLVFPSWIESFGLTTVEAWERGVPALTSDIHAFLEVKSYAPESEKELTFELKNIDSLLYKINFFIKSYNNYNNLKYKLSLHELSDKQFGKYKMIGEYQSILKSIY